MAVVEIYLKPECPFCRRALALLDARGVDYAVHDISRNPELREEMIERGGRTTVPQIWVGDTHVGGWDELSSHDRDGRLDALLGSANEQNSQE